MSKHNQPDYYIYAITDSDHLLRIGAAWKNKNGKEGFYLRMNANPLDGKVLMLPNKDKQHKPQEQAGDIEVTA